MIYGTIALTPISNLASLEKNTTIKVNKHHETKRVVGTAKIQANIVKNLSTFFSYC
jgi:hypothetical protein